MSEERPLNVLFLCTGNSARSIMAEAILGREGRGRFRAFSAGSQPKGALHPFTVHLLEKLNYDPSRFRSKSWAEFTGPDAPALDFVFTVCDNAANELCPVWPGQPLTANWGVPDPAAIEDDETVQHAAFFDTYRMLFNRISLFTNLPFEGLDRMSLQNRLKAIGKESAPADVTTKTEPPA